MGVWSYAVGTVYTRKDANISIKELAKTIFTSEHDAHVITETHGEYYLHKIDICDELDSNDAYAKFSNFFDKIKELDRTAKVDVEISIRVLK